MKILIILLSLVLLSACAQSTAFLGPVITAQTSGNILQAGFSYGGNIAVKEITGKTPAQHVSSYVVNKNEESKIKKEMIIYLERHIEVMRIKTRLERARTKLTYKK